MNIPQIAIVLLIISVFLISIGALMNMFVLIGNNKRMPVMTEDHIDTKKHFNFVDKEKVRLWLLSDIFRIETPKGDLFFSIGDVLIWLGWVISFIVFVIIVALTLRTT